MDDSHPLPPRLLALLEDMPLERLAFAPVPVRARHDGWTAPASKASSFGSRSAAAWRQRQRASA